ncbi:MAG TPA: DUF5667 domain-containing protein [Candidatus Dormibacteraeota bacterium]|nr:DUF5667 domain-containing protein [Candidatus Dormibacteraeota bacterium]
MELNDGDDLSAAERRLASELSQLAIGPTPERRAAIMSAVSRRTGWPPVVIGRWRPALAGLAAAAAIAACTIGVAASGDALPSSPAYPVRLVGERIRITVAGPADREHLRITFAHERIRQATARLSHGDRSNAEELLHDSRAYLTDAKNELRDAPAGEQGQIQNQLNQAQADEQQAETQMNQEGAQGS